MSAEQNWEYWPGFNNCIVKNAGGDNEIIRKISDNIIQPHTEYVDVDTQTELLRDQ